MKITTSTATAVVVANMIGTGVFTSLGFQLSSITNTWSVIFLWSLGAIMALSGALSYAELGTKLARSGGEYHFLSKIYSKHVGFLSGWCSLTVGFAAPIALAAMAAGAYTENYFPGNSKIVATFLIVFVSISHMFDLEKSSRFQNITTLLKVLLIVLFIVIGFIFQSSENALELSSNWQKEIFLPSFAISLIYVTYSFSGWNAAAYIVDEIADVRKNLPIALIGGTLIVSVLYILLQLVFIKHATVPMLAGNLEIGQIVANNLFGDLGGKIISGLIAFMLISSISAMVWVGPRVTKSMADDYQLLKSLGKTNSKGIPNRAIAFQAFIALIMIWTGSFEQVLTYSGFILQLFVSLTVLSLFKVRKKQSLSGYKSPFFPIPQVIFLSISLWILIFIIVEKPFESLVGLGILGVGSIAYFIDEYLSRLMNMKRA